MNLIPATILTGFLGSGKTTLLKRILSEPHGMKIAVIENEYGEENIDSALLVQDTAEQIVQMSNGCVCCSIRGDLAEALADLADRRARGEIAFDRVVIETTGLADPGPVAQTFFMDDAVADAYLLDAVITLVDARHGQQQLDAHLEAQRQAGFADRIVITKTDLVDAEAVARLRSRLAHLNPRAPVVTANFGDLPLADFFDLRGFNLNAKLDIDPHFLDEDDHVHDAHCGHDHHDHDHDPHHGHGHAGDRHNHHADRIGAVVFRASRPFDGRKLEFFLERVLAAYGEQLLRYKGVLDVVGSDRKVVLQGVHQMMGTDLAGLWGDEVRQSRIVWIGVDLPRAAILEGLEACLSS